MAIQDFSCVCEKSREVSLNDGGTRRPLAVTLRPPHAFKHDIESVVKLNENSTLDGNLLANYIKNDMDL